MSGNFGFFVAILLIQNLLCMTTTTTVMTRTVVQHIVRARGVALAIVASGPALTVAIAGPLLNNFVNAHGWRAGYLVLAVYTLVGGALALALVPPDRGGRAGTKTLGARAAKRDYGLLLRLPAFWVLLGGIILTHLSQFISNGQLSVLLLDHGMASRDISAMIAVFAIGTLAGRFACGAALDRFSAPLVAAMVTGAPAIGLFMIASNINTPIVLGIAVLLRGLSYGAEADLIGYLVARIFGVRTFGTVLGLMAASISLGSSGGAVLLSLTLKATGSYQLFLIVSGVLAVIGSLLFLLLPTGARPEDADIEALTATASTAG
jgi:predicted MFS family arabinose efflux permease